MKKILSFALALVILLAFSGCSLPHIYSLPDKTFSSNGLEITLTQGFVEAEYEGYTACFDSVEIAVFTLKEDKAQLSSLIGDMTLDEYSEYVRKGNSGYSPSELKQGEGYTYFEYSLDSDEEGKIYKYYTTMHESDDAFWLIQFCAHSDIYDSCGEYFAKWAESAKFE